MARRSRIQAAQPADEPERPESVSDPALDMMSSVRFADEPEPEGGSPASGGAPSIEEVLPPEASTRRERMAAMNRAFAERNTEAAMAEQSEIARRSVEAPVLPALDHETFIRLRPKIYRILRSPDRQGAYQIPAGVMRVRTPGVSLVELYPGQIITDRDYDVDRLQSECGVIVEDYKVPASA